MFTCILPPAADKNHCSFIFSKHGGSYLLLQTPHAVGNQKAPDKHKRFLSTIQWLRRDWFYNLPLWETPRSLFYHHECTTFFFVNKDTQALLLKSLHVLNYAFIFIHFQLNLIIFKNNQRDEMHNFEIIWLIAFFVILLFCSSLQGINI